jgi:hypothetical protein
MAERSDLFYPHSPKNITAGVTSSERDEVVAFLDSRVIGKVKLSPLTHLVVVFSMEPLDQLPRYIGSLQ